MANNEMCALYLMQDTLSGDTKIGISNNPRERKKEVEQKYNVGKVRGISITWFFSRKEALDWEDKFHKRFKLKHSPERGGNEWFKLNKREVEEFIEWMRENTKSSEQKIEILKNLLNDEK